MTSLSIGKEYFDERLQTESKIGNPRKDQQDKSNQPMRQHQLFKHPYELSIRQLSTNASRPNDASN